MNCTNPPFSLVVPAHQEEHRLGRTLEVLLDYLHGHHREAELIVVSGASTDGTVRLARSFECRSPVRMRVLDLDRGGKGAAVRAGVLEAVGDAILFTDADLSYHPVLFGEFLGRLNGGADIAIAQRVGRDRYANPARNLITRGASALISSVLVRGIEDSQAGLKAFRKPVAQDLFRRQRTDRFCFDIEILLLARRQGHRIETVEVDWEDRPGSTVRPARDLLHGAIDTARIFWYLGTGAYDSPASDTERAGAGPPGQGL